MATVIVREGDVFSSKQLQDVSIENAQTLIILDNEFNVTAFDSEAEGTVGRGNVQTIKTLMQAINLIERRESKCKIIVEINDMWTNSLVDKISVTHRATGNVQVFAAKANTILGQILSQFSLMPELNFVYNELFSNKGSAFYSKAQNVSDEVEYITEYLKNHPDAIPLSFMSTSVGDHGFYSAIEQDDIDTVREIKESNLTVSLNPDYVMPCKNVILLGHNSKCRDIMQGFVSFCGEWQHGDREVVRVVVIDEKESLEKVNYYRDYPFVIEAVAANIYDKDLLCNKIENFIGRFNGEASVLILSDDSVSYEDRDANVFANLVYLKDVLEKKALDDPEFDASKINVITEIINPKHHEIANNYSSSSVVISDRYISKMISQICEKDAMFAFYQDILTYDSDDEAESKEIYIKNVDAFFTSIPEKCTYKELLDAVFYASVELDRTNPMLTLGYVKRDGTVVVFEGDLTVQNVALQSGDKLILFADH